MNDCVLFEMVREKLLISSDWVVNGLVKFRVKVEMPVELSYVTLSNCGA